MTKGHVVKKISEQVLLYLWGINGPIDICESTARDCEAMIKALVILAGNLQLLDDVLASVKGNISYHSERYDAILAGAINVDLTDPAERK